MIEDAIIDKIVKLTGLRKKIVKLVVSQSNGDFQKFLELLQTAKIEHKAGNSMDKIINIISKKDDLDDLINKGEDLVDAVINGDTSSVVDTITDGASSAINDKLDDLSDKIPTIPDFPW